jgi:four helix bundle suffix protein
LTNVAKASFLELLLDYEDFLRVRNLPQWTKDSVQAQFIRDKSKDSRIADQWFVDLAKNRSAEVVANMAICFLHQADYLLQKQLDSLEQKFLNNGGFREQLLHARLEARKK